MKVTESPEGVKGDTASNVQKPATLETGLTVQVPLFIKEGEIIKVNTADRSYAGRASLSTAILGEVPANLSVVLKIAKNHF